MHLGLTTTQLTNWEECWPCPVFASYTLAFALQLRKKHGKTSAKPGIRVFSIGVSSQYQVVRINT
jgi:hypothetical protein